MKDAVRRAALRASRAAYRLLLRRYPRRLRRRYGDEMAALFDEEAARRTEEAGLRGLGAVWWKAIRDLLRPVPGPVGPERRADTGRAADPARSATRSRLGLRGLAEDLSFAARSLRRAPRFTGLVVGVLAVGIALNTSALAVLNAYVLRPLPFPQSDRLFNVRGGQGISWTEVDEVFELAVSWDLDVFTVIGDGRPEMAPGAWVTPDFLETYGVRAQVGRTFRPDEAGRGGAPVAMISHRLWQERFEGDPEIVGRTFSAFTSDRPDHAELFTIVGVLPADFWYLNEYTEVLAPIRDERAVYAGRLRPDIPVERAETVLTELAERRMEQVPAGFRVELVSVQERHVASVRPTLMTLQAAVLLVLLIACANAAVLLLIRSARRERELGIRRAMGASGGRLARQLLLEGGLLSLTATSVGLVLTSVLLSLTGASVESRLGVMMPGGAQSLAIDGTVLLGAAGLAALVGLVFGLVPLLSSVRGIVGSTLREGRGSTDSRTRHRFRAALVAGEVALSLALLVGAGLMVRSAVNLQHQELGFDPDRVVRGVMGLREASYPDPEDRVAAFSRLRERLAAVPGVEEVGLGSLALFGTRFTPRRVEGEDGDDLVGGEAVWWLVGERYFDALDIPVVHGRAFTRDDAAGAEPAAVVSESLARALWGDADPLGRRVRTVPTGEPGMAPPDPGPWLRVVGVVADVQRGVDDGPGGDLYRTYRQGERSWMNAVVRFRDDPVARVAELQAAVAAVDPEIPLASVRRLDEVVNEAMGPTRAVAGLLVGFAAFALLLAVLGLYGVVSYAVRQRQKDVAIRMALGAGRGSVTAMFLRQGLVVIGTGIVLGTLGGLALGRALEDELHGVGPGDPTTHVLLAGILAFGALLAVWLPARRAAGADPMGVLREE